jgi:chemotaxis family two-component system response regulator Rcp1
MPDSNQKIILQVDDDDASAYLFGVAVEESGCSATVHRVRDGDEAMQFLNREGPHEVAPTPDLIVLDLSMPMMDGWELLKRRQASNELRRVPVLVLSTSDIGNHRTNALELGADEFVTKPLLIEDLYTVVKDLCSRFLSVGES